MIDWKLFSKLAPHAVKFIDKTNARHFIIVRIAPVRFRLRFDAGDAVEDDDRAVENAQRALHFDREVDVARRVDQVDLMFVLLVLGRLAPAYSSASRTPSSRRS